MIESLNDIKLILKKDGLLTLKEKAKGHHLMDAVDPLKLRSSSHGLVIYYSS